MSAKREKRKFAFPVNSLAGSSLPNFIRLLTRHKVHPKYYMRLILTLLVSLILEPFRLWESLLWRRRIRKIEIKSPVFIIGFWRTGTTLLHNLLCQDPNAAFVSTFQTIFPHLVLSQGWWLKRLLNNFLPAYRPFDNVIMHMDFPQEEEIAMANIQGISFYKFWYFPQDFDLCYRNELVLDHARPQWIRRWEHAYGVLIRKAMINTGGTRFISKNPSNLGRIPQLLEIFPDARFIFTYRDPYSSLESFYRFSDKVLPATSLQQVPDSRSREPYARIYSDLLARYDADRALIPPQNLIELRYEELEKDKIGVLRQIYSRLGWPGWEEALPHFQSYIESIKGYEKTRYDITPETIEMVNEFLNGHVNSWGYRARVVDNS